MTLIPAELLEGLKGGWCVPLLEEHQVYLFVPDRDGHRFADLFRKTWNHLPGHATKRILRHWRAPCPFAPVLRPQIELVGDWSGRIVAMSETFMEGNHLAFHKPSVDRMPDHLVETLIARELARVFDIALVGSCNRDAKEACYRPGEIAESWGFDDNALGGWWVKTYGNEMLKSR
jgi:hypothetical protein